MKIIRIFENSLYAVKYPDEKADEFSRLFNLWNNIELLRDFFNKNINDLRSGYWPVRTVNEAVLKNIEFALNMENHFYELLDKRRPEQETGLEKLFLPLRFSQTGMLTLRESKARKSWLRLYALRIDKNVYLVTGGAIKLTHKMQDREHTMKELRKIEQCKSFLLQNGIIDIEGLIDEMEAY